MGKTTRNNREHLRESKERYVRDRAQRGYIHLLLWGYESVPNTNRKADYDAAYDAYSAAWDAWDARGQQEGFEPLVPEVPHKRKSVPFDGRPFAVYVAQNRAAFAREYDKGARDGQQYPRYDIAHKEPSTRRVDDRRILSAIVKDPDRWEDDSLVQFRDNGTNFRDYYY